MSALYFAFPRTMQQLKISFNDKLWFIKQLLKLLALVSVDRKFDGGF